MTLISDPQEVNALPFTEQASLLLINKSVHTDMPEAEDALPWKLAVLLGRACQVG